MIGKVLFLLLDTDVFRFREVLFNWDVSVLHACYLQVKQHVDMLNIEF